MEILRTATNLRVPLAPFAKGGIHKCRVSHPLPRTQRGTRRFAALCAVAFTHGGFIEENLSAAHAAIVVPRCRKSVYASVGMTKVVAGGTAWAAATDL
jgi:hypothetical protein